MAKYDRKKALETYGSDIFEEEQPDFPPNEPDLKTYENPNYALASGTLADNDNPQRKLSYSS